MATTTLYINRSKNQLMAGLSSSQVIAANTIPLFYNDTLSINVYILAEGAGFNPNDPNSSTLTNESTAGRTLQFYLDDGTVSGTIYTQQLTWTPDATNKFFAAALPLNTGPLATLIGTATQATLWFKIGIIEGGVQTTIFSAQGTLLVGLPTASVPTVPAGQTALSQEVARGTYLPIEPIAGQPIYFESPNGKIFAIIAEDQADGTAIWKVQAMN